MRRLAQQWTPQWGPGLLTSLLLIGTMSITRNCFSKIKLHQTQKLSADSSRGMPAGACVMLSLLLTLWKYAHHSGLIKSPF